MTTRNVNAALPDVRTEFRIEELLNRQEIILQSGNIQKHILNRRILITGASGSIGSELARQIAYYHPAELVLLDKCEGTLASLELELRQLFSHLNLNIQMADVTDKVRIRHIFETAKPQVVYHAAALKHVPFVEKQQYDAVKINVIGTKILADISTKMKVEKFVFVSTDKAVNPSSFMGVTKRFGEIIMASQNKGIKKNTQFITARFGNVLGSSGSVVNIFEGQISAGGPVTITHKDMTRYFMTPFEAGQLLLEAGAVGRDGQLMIFRMGEPVKISDLALKMILLRGLEPYTDIDIVFTQVRPGEKLKEELLNNTDRSLPSHHTQIVVMCLRDSSIVNVHEYIGKIKEAMLSNNTTQIKYLLKTAVPEYIDQRTDN